MSRSTPWMILVAAVASLAGEARAGFAWLGDWEATGQGSYWTYSEPGLVTGVARSQLAIDSDEYGEGHVDLERTFWELLVLTRHFEIRDAPDGLPIEVLLSWYGEIGLVRGVWNDPGYRFFLGDVLEFSWHYPDYRDSIPRYGNFLVVNFQEATVILPEGVHTVRIEVFSFVDWARYEEWFSPASGRSELTAFIRPVPEPASIALVGLGCLGLALAPRRLTRRRPTPRSS